MFSIISVYVKKLAIFLIFNSFIGILMPNDRYKNYINLTMGIIFMLIMLQPVQDIFKSTTEVVFAKEYELNQKITENEIEIFEKNQQEMILNHFKDSITEQTRSLLEDYGEISSVDVEVLNVDDKVDIGGISVSFNTYNDENTTNEKIKKILSDFYNLDKGNINITIR